MNFSSDIEIPYYSPNCSRWTRAARQLDQLLRLSILSGISWKSVTGSSDDDWVDRVNHLWTVSLLMVFAVIVSTVQYVGNPIHCWCPAEFTGTFVEYTKNYCWISNTYYIPQDSSIPKDIASRQAAEISYYQWVPIILLFMSFLFKIPNIIWHLWNTKSGINLMEICELCNGINVGKFEDREECLVQIARYLDRWLRENRNYHQNLMVRIRHKISNLIFCFAKRDGCFLTGFYVFIKILYCVNCVCQFILLDAFLGMDFGGYGFEIIKYFRGIGEWNETLRFPRVTLCDFVVRQLQNVQRYTVQCVLPINLFNEKIFAVIWFWLFLVSVLSFYNLVSWLFYLYFNNSNEKLVRKYLRVTDQIKTGFDKKRSRKFANDYLRADGCFLLKMVGKNSTDIVLSDLIRILWTMFNERPFHRWQYPNVETDDLMPSDLDESASRIRLTGSPNKRKKITQV